MRAYLGFLVGAATCLPVAAHAACEPVFPEGSTTVTLVPAPAFEQSQLEERFFVRVSNNGDETCTLRLVVGRDIAASDARFPSFSLAGPNGNIPVVEPLGAVGSGIASTISVGPGGQVSVPYDVYLDVGWGSEAGTYDQQLVFQLVEPETQGEIARQLTRLSLEIPPMARVRFAGASGARGPVRIDMGELSPTAPTTSPPFAFRVLSTSAYRMELSSENRGALLRIGGSERIPYRLSVGNQTLNLGAAGDTINVGRHTGAEGDVHSVSIVVDPDPTRHAGNYSDRVTVTVTAI